MNFMRGEAARAVSTRSPFFEGEAKFVKRRSCSFGQEMSEPVGKTSKARIGNDLRSKREL